MNDVVRSTDRTVVVIQSRYSIIFFLCTTLASMSSLVRPWYSWLLGGVSILSVSLCCGDCGYEVWRIEAFVSDIGHRCRSRRASFVLMIYSNKYGRDRQYDVRHAPGAGNMHCNSGRMRVSIHAQLATCGPALIAVYCRWLVSMTFRFWVVASSAVL